LPFEEFEFVEGHHEFAFNVAQVVDPFLLFEDGLFVGGVLLVCDPDFR
jgi:hypothetical protein